MKASAFSTMVIVFTSFAGTTNNASHMNDNVDRQYDSHSLFASIFDLNTVIS